MGSESQRPYSVKKEKVMLQFCIPVRWYLWAQSRSGAITQFKVREEGPVLKDVVLQPLGVTLP